MSDASSDRRGKRTATTISYRTAAICKEDVDLRFAPSQHPQRGQELSLVLWLNTPSSRLGNYCRLCTPNLLPLPRRQVLKATSLAQGHPRLGRPAFFFSGQTKGRVTEFLELQLHLGFLSNDISRVLQRLRLPSCHCRNNSLGRSRFLGEDTAAAGAESFVADADISV
eukprot:scaffold3740_cov146-Amphora_coffeaeformis.AAC.3